MDNIPSKTFFETQCRAPCHGCNSARVLYTHLHVTMALISLASCSLHIEFSQHGSAPAQVIVVIAVSKAVRWFTTRRVTVCAFNGVRTGRHRMPCRTRPRLYTPSYSRPVYTAQYQPTSSNNAHSCTQCLTVGIQAAAVVAVWLVCHASLLLFYVVESHPSLSRVTSSPFSQPVAERDHLTIKRPAHSY